MSVDQDIDEALKSKLVNISLDYSNVRDILSELSNQIENIKASFALLSSSKETEELKKEIGLINSKVETLGHNVNSVVSANNAIATNLEKQFSNFSSDTQEVISKKNAELREFTEKFLEESVKNMLEDIKNNELSNFATIDMHNDLLFKVDQLDDSIKKVGKNTSTGSYMAEQIDKINERLLVLENNMESNEKVMVKATEDLDGSRGKIDELQERIAKIEESQNGEPKPILSSRGMTLDEHVTEIDGQINNYDSMIQEIRNNMTKMEGVPRMQKELENKIKKLEERLNAEDASLSKIIELQASINEEKSQDTQEEVIEREYQPEQEPATIPEAELNRINESISSNQMRIINLENIIAEIADKTGINTSGLSSHAVQTDDVQTIDDYTSPFVSRPGTPGSQASLTRPGTAGSYHSTRPESANSLHSSSRQDTPGSQHSLSRENSNSIIEGNYQQTPESVNGMHGLSIDDTQQNSKSFEFIQPPPGEFIERKLSASTTNSSRNSSSRVSVILPIEEQAENNDDNMTTPTIPFIKELPENYSAHSSRLNSASSRKLGASGRASVRSQTYEEIDILTKALKLEQDNMVDELKEITAQIEECKDGIARLRKKVNGGQQFNSSFSSPEAKEKIEDVSSKIQNISDTYAKKETVNKALGQISLALESILGRLDANDEKLGKYLTKDEFVKYIKGLASAAESDNTTAAATSGYKCLLCGRPKGGVVGMITDSEIARLMGEPSSSTPAKVGNDTYVLNYGTTSIRPKTATSTIRRPKSSKLPKIGD